MNNPLLFKSRRLRSTPFTSRNEAAGVKAYTVYNHMLLPTMFESMEADYWHLCEHVQVWDVACERQVELRGPDAARLAQLMTPRDLSKLAIYQGKYAPICTAEGFLLNDPIIIKLADDRFWISIADSDIKLFAAGLAQGYGLDVQVFEPDVFPLAIQGPKSDELAARVFGEEVRSIGFFRGKMLDFMGHKIYVARSGFSKQGGFEVYIDRVDLCEQLWDALFEAGGDLNVRAGCPNGIERIESGLLSFGNDMDEFDTPFECGLDSFLDLDAQIESLSLAKLREKAGDRTRRLVGLAFDAAPDLSDHANHIGGFDIVVNGETIGELRTQVWSSRFQKLLAFAMLPLDFLANNEGIELDGRFSEFHPIPFDPSRL